jgi:hypothetical protein
MPSEAGLSANAENAAQRSLLSAFNSDEVNGPSVAIHQSCRTQQREQMTLKIETQFDGDKLTLRLSGRVQKEHLDALRVLLDNANAGTVVNLCDVNLVGVEVVRFLANCEMSGVELVDCSPYIRDWINREVNKLKTPNS